MTGEVRLKCLVRKYLPNVAINPLPPHAIPRIAKDRAALRANHQYFNDSDADVFTGTGGGRAPGAPTAPPRPPRELVELGLEDEWLEAVTYVEVGPEGERIDKREYVTRWQEVIRSRAADDVLLRKVRDDEPLDATEEEELARRLNRPEHYFNEENLRRAYREPGGNLIDFIRAALGKLRIKSREETPPADPPEGESATRRVWFYEVRNDGYDPDKIQGGGRPETPEKNDIPGLLAAWADYKAARFEKPPGVEAGAVLPPGTEEPRCWWASFETIAENDFNLAASRYKPRVSEAVPEEDPVKLIREVLAIERDIAAGLEKLLKELEE